MKKIAVWLFIGSVCIAQPPKKKLIWEENFNGKTLDEKFWNFELGAGGWGNNERQTYTKDNHKLVEGMLIITAKKDGEKYTSTRLTTKGKKEFQYGRIEARAKLPVGYGIWPAFWMLGSNIDKAHWPKSGEIDILEYIGREPDMVYTTLHTQANHGEHASSKKTKFENIEEGFHTYAVDWTKEKMEFFVDGQSVYIFNPENKTEDIWPFNQPFYILLNMAVGGNFGGPNVDDAIFPQQFTIDYVRVYE